MTDMLAQAGLGLKRWYTNWFFTTAKVYESDEIEQPAKFRLLILTSFDRTTHAPGQVEETNATQSPSNHCPTKHDHPKLEPLWFEGPMNRSLTSLATPFESTGFDSKMSNCPRT